MSEKQNQKISGKKSTEQLAHFVCGHCQKWWSIGDAPLGKETWYCPWCGQQQSINEVKASKKHKN